MLRPFTTQAYRRCRQPGRWLWLAAVLALSACATSVAPAATPSPTPGAFTYFPQTDLPIGSVSQQQQVLWQAYGVTEVPGAHVLDQAPSAPAVTNDTNGVVPPSTAQLWAAGLYHDEAWQQWALAHSQTGLQKHLDYSDQFISNISQDHSLTYPACAAFPTSLTLEPDTITEVGGIQQAPQVRAQYTFIGQLGAPCSVVQDNADGTTMVVNNWSSPQTVEITGFYEDDPVLGGLFVPVSTQTCVDLCPTLSPSTASAAPSLPATDTPIGAASPALQAVWAPYEVNLVPTGTVTADQPQPPTVVDETFGAISPGAAQKFGVAVYQQAAWQKWMWEHNQLQFMEHISNPLVLGTTNPLDATAESGSHDLIPNCAVYPSKITLQLVGPGDITNNVGVRDAFKLVLTYPTPCSVTANFADGTSQKVDMSKASSVTQYGSIREDPLLGPIWYPDAEVNNNVGGL